MNKLWLIVQREYLTRVTKRTFILATILTPLGFGLFFFFATWLMSYEGEDAMRVLLIDQDNIVQQPDTVRMDNGLEIVRTQEDLATLRAMKNPNFDGILVAPTQGELANQTFTLNYYTKDQLNFGNSNTLERIIRSSIEDYKMGQLGVTKAQLDDAQASVRIDPQPLEEGVEDDKSSISAFIGMGLGGFMGFVMYLGVFIYGMMVMRSVMEEKMNRIVEVMVSSIKPFQMMLGKIIGVGLVGLTQVAIWLVLIPVIAITVQSIFGLSPDQVEMQTAAQGVDVAATEAMLPQIFAEFGSQNWLLIIPAFVVFFLGGYFIYASLFAAVGSAMGDDLGEGQALTLPITIPVIIAFYIMFAVINNPDSSMAFWASMFPLFSPIVMPARLAFDPPLWEVLLSATLLIGTAVFLIWVSARIYRIGILMYGKKVGFKEIGKWMFTRN